MALQFERIRNANHPYINQMLSLYCESFPFYERRTPEQLLEMLSDIEEMELDLLKDGETFVGLMVIWNFGQFTYLEHFAIDTTLRGKSYGSQAIGQLMNRSERLLFEVEPATGQQSEKRIAFYLRNGFQTLDFIYHQPPYRRGDNTFRMHLLSNNSDWTQEQLTLAAELIKEQVYSRFW
jgi:ribosomal protein S18 acetylase RimI-like enzyme